VEKKPRAGRPELISQIEMLKKIKHVALQSLKTTGVSAAVHQSRWRRQRLLILAYHGISLDDEHAWNSGQYISADLFSARLNSLRKSGCAVLPLGEALERLFANDLPPKSVAITFDDGTYDFAARAFPLLREFNFPVTLYLTTFYSEFNRPVFDLMCAYLLWKGRNQKLDLKPIIRKDLQLDLMDADAQAFTIKELHEFTRAQKLSAEEKDALLKSLARELRVDYEELVARRVMHNLTPAEVTQLSNEGVDIQLHTHRHRTPMDRELFLREIEDNRKSIISMIGKAANHFCYPSGKYHASFLPWLREAGIVSATTCESGFATQTADPLLLPRVLDAGTLTQIEFEGWLSGISAALPRRK
jgi:peptidoglycan/xylan/chitin deacetylase (PgdA/CDA1 family)